jgi:glyoxylase-like metal-dependent hydrolase (beta-lactamase superfamily II)
LLREMPDPHHLTEPLVQIAPRIFLVEGEKNGHYPFAHSILIRDEITALIDTGCGVRRLEQIKERYAPDLVINSHTHPDHSAGNWVFQGIPLMVPKEGFETSGQFLKLSYRFTEPGKLARTWRAYVQEAMDFREALPTSQFQDGQILHFGKVELEAIHTPGHSIDHYCFREPNRGILFAFDIDLGPFGPWYGTRECDIDALEESIRHVQALGPHILVSSHTGIMTSRLNERLEAYLAVISERDQRILALLSEEWSLKEMVERALIYGGFPYVPELLRYWEGQMLSKHVQRLMRRGLVREHEGTYVRI